jgi:hypothetical protein
MQYDETRIDQAVLALLALYSFEKYRAWKGFDFDVMNRLHEQGLIDNPTGKAKSVWLTEQGLQNGLKYAAELFRNDNVEKGSA